MTDPSEKRRTQRRSPKSTKTPTFEESLAALESIVQSLEAGELGLSESLDQYEQGVQCLKHCYQQLEQAEQRVELLKQIDTDGVAQTERFDETEMDLHEKTAARVKRRTATRAARQQNQNDSGVDDSPGLF